MKALTISIAAYNAEKWLETCLNSFVVPEILEDIEVLIINDGSTDGTAEIAREYVSKYPDTFILINKENGGHGSTINTGIKAATGKYFKLVDADDWVEKKGLLLLVNKLKSIDADAVLSPYYHVNANDMNKKIMYCIKDFNEPIDKILDIDSIQSEFSLCMHGLTYRTSLLQENFIAIDEHCFYVDQEYVVFYFRLVKNVYVSDVPVYNYLIGTNEQSVNRANMVKRRDQHLTVCKKLMEFYDSISGTVPVANSQIIKKVISNLYSNQVHILLEIEDKTQSQKELSSFIIFIKTNYASLYKEIIGYGKKEKKATIILSFILDKIHFHFYGLIHKIVHSVKKEVS